MSVAPGPGEITFVSQRDFFVRMSSDRLNAHVFTEQRWELDLEGVLTVGRDFEEELVVLGAWGMGLYCRSSRDETIAAVQVRTSGSSSHVVVTAVDRPGDAFFGAPGPDRPRRRRRHPPGSAYPFQYGEHFDFAFDVTPRQDESFIQWITRVRGMTAYELVPINRRAALMLVAVDKVATDAKAQLRAP